MIFYVNDEAYLNSFKCDKEKWGLFVSLVTIFHLVDYMIFDTNYHNENLSKS